MDARAPVTVVGAGPAGVRFVQELHRRQPTRRIVVFGAEPCEPYDRVRLSAALAGECSWQALRAAQALPRSEVIETRFGENIVAIDRERRLLRSARGEEHRYGQLVLATGSAPHVPDIPGRRLGGVYTFRDLADAERLVARRVRSRRIVVLGGGLLGLEAARAMRRFHTGITVVEHAERLMPRQLDGAAAACLQAELAALSIEVVAGDGASAILGEGAVAAVRLRSGRELICDTVIIATGIVPRVELALRSNLPVGRGIRIDDRLCTADADIFAIGECAEHRGVVYGLVAPCHAQAAVAAAVVAGGEARYVGSSDATRLKIFTTPVFSAGLHPEQAIATTHAAVEFRDEKRPQYRKLVLNNGRLAGLLGVGEWNELPRALEALERRVYIWPWQRLLFQRWGRLWSERPQSVAQWPASATVCNCTGVTRGQLSAAIESGCRTPAALAQCTRASTVCGSCGPLLSEMLGAQVKPQPAAGWRFLLGTALVACMAALALSMLPGLGYVPAWSEAEWRWDAVWRDGFIKQFSGYSLLGLATLGLVMSLRKRLPRLQFGGFAWWRGLHVMLGTVAIGVLLLHTGGRIGYGLNAWLMSAFVAVIGAGGLAAAIVAMEHRLSPVQAKRVRRQITWLHVLAFWPLPVLLAFHVLKIYYF